MTPRIEIDASLEPVEKNEWSSKMDQDSREILHRKLAGGSELLHSTVPEDFEICHLNLLGYLSHCWGRHHEAMISPDMVWYSILCEMASLIKEDPEQWRDLFTDSEGKKELLVLAKEYTEEGVPILNMRLFYGALSENVPGGIEKYLIPFSTTDSLGSFAQQAAFMDAVSPFYNYSMYLCGIPGVIVSGVEEDWDRMEESCVFLQEQMSRNEEASTWAGTALEVIRKFKGAFTDQGSVDWEKMFYLKMCGSGSQYTVHGWLTELYRKIPEYALQDNFSSHVSEVKYTMQYPTGKVPFVCKVGLFHSVLMPDNVLVPSFGYVICDGKES